MILKCVGFGICLCGVLGAASSTTTTRVKNPDEDFMKVAAIANMTAVHEAQIAASRATADVKAFGQQLAQDQSNAYGQLLDLAKKTGESIPRGVDLRRNPDVEQLMRLKGSRFDQRFIQAEIRNDEKTIAVFRREAEHGRNADVKAYAGKTIPLLETDLHRAQELAQSAKKKS